MTSICMQCGQERPPSPAEVWRDEAERKAQAYAEKELETHGYPVNTLFIDVASFNHKMKPDGTYDIAFTARTHVSVCIRHGYDLVVANGPIERVVAAAIVFLKAWEGRYTPEAP